MERVELREGKIPVIVFAPHGFNGNDENTSIMARSIAKEINAYAVINKGWERSDVVNCFDDKADCNNVEHCHEYVVKDEVLDPLIRFIAKAKKNHGTAFLYNIHGMSDRHRKKAQDKMDVVIGFGDGDPPSFSMDIWRKDFFVSKLNVLGINAYEGKAGGNMSGWSRNNMNQLFRKWYLDSNVQSLQIEVTHELRSDVTMALITSDYLATCMLELINITNFSTSEKFKKY